MKTIHLGNDISEQEYNDTIENYHSVDEFPSDNGLLKAVDEEISQFGLEVEVINSETNETFFRVVKK